MEPIRDHVSQKFHAASEKVKKIPLKLSEVKSNSVALNRLGFKKIAQGADKMVVIPANKALKQAHAEAKVYYVPVRIFFLNKKNALKKEFAKIGQVKTRLYNNERARKHLAVEVRQVTGYQQVGKKLTLEVDRAKQDGEITIRDKELGWENRTRLGGEFLEGLSGLHDADFAYGDLKPENTLVYENDGKLILKLADFGKARDVKTKAEHMYKGNLRFAPPEGVLSKPGDVFGAAIALIRILEEEVLEADGEPLAKVDSEHQEDTRATAKVRGVERYVTDHKDCPGIQEPTLKDKLFRRLPRQAMLSSRSQKKKEAHVKAIEIYINNLVSCLPIDTNQKTQLDRLLKKMTEVNPNSRPAMDQVVSEFQMIFPPFQEELDQAA